jgi:hypothetical protein
MSNQPEYKVRTAVVPGSSVEVIYRHTYNPGASPGTVDLIGLDGPERTVTTSTFASAGTAVRASCGPARVIQPLGDLGGVEPDEPPDPQERHSPLGDQAPDMPMGHPEPLGELVDAQQLG